MKPSLLYETNFVGLGKKKQSISQAVIMLLVEINKLEYSAVAFVTLTCPTLEVD